MDDSTTEPAGADPNAPAGTSAKASRTAAARQQYHRVRERVDASTPGRVRQRARELDVANHALILASLSLTLLVPALVTLAAFLPIGSGTGVANGAIRRLGLTSNAARDVRALFPTKQKVAGSTTALSAAITVFFAIGWPAELARGYQSIWGLPGRGLRDLWRALPWLVSFFAIIVLVVSSSRLVSGPGGVVLTGIVGLPVTFGWSWWGPHLLLGGRIGWRPLLPGAVATSLLLFGFSLAMHVYLPRAIVSNFDKYGPIGVVLAFLSWIIGFSIVMLGGPLVGHTVYAARRAGRSAP